MWVRWHNVYTTYHGCEQNNKTLCLHNGQKRVNFTYYKVSGGPMINTSHLWMSLSSTRPAENPSTGFLFSSEMKTENALLLSSMSASGQEADTVENLLMVNASYSDVCVSVRI